MEVGEKFGSAPGKEEAGPAKQNVLWPFGPHEAGYRIHHTHTHHLPGKLPILPHFCCSTSSPGCSLVALLRRPVSSNLRV